ncbi:copper chaperone PCu(A)C [Streptomyces sp. TRM76130]|nr:copper chaperone PCu(A)C [Streptomyces sp. TRM76130]
MSHRSALGAVVLAGGLALTGCGAGDSAGADLSVSGAYVPRPVSDTMAAGFLTITNDGDVEDELTSVTSDAGEVTVHRTVDGTMRQVDSLPIPAHGELALRSGGDHLMFEKLEQRPEEGQALSVELHFADSDPVTVEMPVKSATYQPGATGTASPEHSGH